MSRHLKKDEWLEIVNLYEQYINYDITKKLMYKYIQMKKNILYWNTIFLLIKTKFNNYNLGMNKESQSGKASKKR